MWKSLCLLPDCFLFLSPVSQLGTVSPVAHAQLEPVTQEVHRPQLAPFNVEERRLYAEPLPNCWTPHLTAKENHISKTCIWTQIFFHGVNKKLKPALTDSWCFSPAMLYLVLNGCIKLGHNYLQALSISWNYWYYWIKTIFQVKWWSSKLVRCHFLSSLSVI